jgi:predicted transcriptional regulator
MLPPQAHTITLSEFEVLQALIDVHDADGRATFREVARTVGRSVSWTFGVLVLLRRLGLVTWEHGKTGTLRPAVRIVASDL